MTYLRPISPERSDLVSMISRALSTAAIVVCGVLAAGVSSAQAARTAVHPETFRFEAELLSKRSWAAYLRAEGHRHVELLIHHYDEGARPYVTASYRTVGRVDRHGIDVDFGRFGRIELTFSRRPKRVLHPFPNCKGSKPLVNQYGRLRGTIDFDPLGGLISLEGSGVEGQSWHSPRRVCEPEPSNVYFSENGRAARGLSAETGPTLQTFLARGHLLDTTIDLYAITLEREVVDLAATATRRYGAVLVETTVHAPDDEDADPGKAVDLRTFGNGPRAKAADLMVASPFSGSARYRGKGVGSPSWLGDLAVQMPGEGRVPLAGPEFRAVLCGYLDTRRQRACEREVAPPHVVG